MDDFKYKNGLYVAISFSAHIRYGSLVKFKI